MKAGRAPAGDRRHRRHRRRGVAQHAARPRLSRRQRVLAGCAAGSMKVSRRLAHQSSRWASTSSGAIFKAPTGSIQMISKREGFGDPCSPRVSARLREARRRRRSEASIFLARALATRPRPSRALEEMLDTATSSTATMETATRSTRPRSAAGANQPLQRHRGGQAGGGLRGRRNSRTRWASASSPRARGWRTSARAGRRDRLRYTVEEAMRQGAATAAINRAVALRCGLTPALEFPSKRYGSTPQDGPAKARR